MPGLYDPSKAKLELRALTGPLSITGRRSKGIGSHYKISKVDIAFESPRQDAVEGFFFLNGDTRQLRSFNSSPVLPSALCVILI